MRNLWFDVDLVNFSWGTGASLGTRGLDLRAISVPFICWSVGEYALLPINTESSTEITSSTWSKSSSKA